MAKYLEVHPESPQLRFIKQATEILNKDGVILYPTDTSYGFACSLSSSKAMEKIALIKGFEHDHLFSLVCQSISQVSKYCVVDDRIHRVLKRCLPGPFTFILAAHREVPKKILPKRKTIGVRIPDHKVTQLLLADLQMPLLSSTGQFKDQDPIYDPRDFKTLLLKNLDCVLDLGPIPTCSSTVVDLSEGEIEIVREGIGDISKLGLNTIIQ
jgi:tRNA threonylcarbamoyl adenosine modification protein (Sua5/YciO/YrdC/YwlC family)